MDTHVRQRYRKERLEEKEDLAEMRRLRGNTRQRLATPATPLLGCFLYGANLNPDIAQSYWEAVAACGE